MFFYKRYKEAVRDTPPPCAVKPNTKNGRSGVGCEHYSPHTVLLSAVLFFYTN